ncbi:integrase [Acinetobacter baumannii]|uniref:integrase n=1 Tax=Acinetobacter baumannii TaxID=470 RepID=UPI003AF889A1
MNNIIFFPSATNTAEKNIHQFIEFVKTLDELNPEIKFSDNYWKGEVNFVKAGVSSKDRDPENLIHNSIIEFAKAYVKYQKINNSLKTQDTILSIRAIEQVCIDRREVLLSKLIIADFDAAAEFARNNYKPTSAYHVGRQLGILLKFLNKMGVSILKDWPNPNKKPVERTTVIDQESEDYRASKLPDEDALYKLAEIFSHKYSELSDRDVFTTCAVSILLSAPDRASELFFLKENCWYDSDDEKKLNTLSKSSDKEEPLIGLRWFSQKSYGDNIKVIPNSMVSVVKISIDRLLKLSEKARRFASLLESSNKFPRHDLCPIVNDDELLTRSQVLAAMGFDESLYDNQRQAQISGVQFLRHRGIAIEDYVHTLNDLNTILRARLPKDFPYVSLKTGMGKVRIKWSEALFTCFANQFHLDKVTIFTELWMPDINTLNEDLAPTKKLKKKSKELTNVKSIFERWSYQKFCVTSHQFRHLLNTIAKTNGMSEVLLAKWSGRADPKQNRVYDQRGVEEQNSGLLIMQANEIDNSDFINTLNIATPRTLQELNTRASLATHTTEFGICTHSFIDEPCLKYRNCLNCTEHVCIKGDIERTKRLKDHLKKEKILLIKDQKAVVKGVSGAINWLKIRETTIKRCEDLILILENSDVPDGTRVSLPVSEGIDHLDHSFQKNGQKKLPLFENALQKQQLNQNNDISENLLSNEMWVVQ